MRDGVSMSGDGFVQFGDGPLVPATDIKVKVTPGSTRRVDDEREGRHVGIVEFLTARLDEREQLARAVQHAVGTQYDALMAAMGTTYGLSMVSLYWRSYDPARVLAEVVARRRVLNRHSEFDFPFNPDDGPGDYSWTPYCAGHCHGDVWPCVELRDVAAPYADHPDYDPAWRVEA